MNKQEATEMRERLEQSPYLKGRIIRAVETTPGNYEVREGRICRVCGQPYYTKAIGEGSRTDPCKNCRKDRKAQFEKDAPRREAQERAKVQAHEAFDEHEEPRY